MATITKIQRLSGVRYKVLIKARDGHVLKCKTFTTKSNARQWAKRIEGDRELMQVFGMKGSRILPRYANLPPLRGLGISLLRGYRVMGDPSATP